MDRIAVVNMPHHVTQPGNSRQFILTDDDERIVYLNLSDVESCESGSPATPGRIAGAGPETDPREIRFLFR